jgi:hypothetical protein
MVFVSYGLVLVQVQVREREELVASGAKLRAAAVSMVRGLDRKSNGNTKNKLELELELKQTRMIQKPLLWVEVGKSACVLVGICELRLSPPARGVTNINGRLNQGGCLVFESAFKSTGGCLVSPRLPCNLNTY